MLEQISFKNLRLLCNHKPKVLKQKAALQACKNHTSLDNWVLKTRHCLGFVDASSIRQAPTKNVMFVISNLFNLKPKQFVGRKQKEKQFHESTWVEYVFSFVWNKLNRRRDESKTPSYANTFFGGITFLVPGHSLNFSQFFIKIYNSWIKGLSLLGLGILHFSMFSVLPLRKTATRISVPVTHTCKIPTVLRLQ